MDISNLNKKIDLAEGVWIDEIPDNEGLRLLVRSSNYKPFRVATAGQARRSGKKLQSDEGLMEFTVAAGKPLAEHILLGWEGITDGGAPLKFSVATATALLTADDDHGIGNRFRRAVEYAADRAAEILAETTKEAAGN